jgi:hypothetical protein
MLRLESRVVKALLRIKSYCEAKTRDTGLRAMASRV